jgi:hypothetical protein
MSDFLENIMCQELYDASYVSQIFGDTRQARLQAQKTTSKHFPLSASSLTPSHSLRRLLHRHLRPSATIQYIFTHPPNNTNTRNCSRTSATSTKYPHIKPQTWIRRRLSRALRHYKKQSLRSNHPPISFQSWRS